MIHLDLTDAEQALLSDVLGYSYRAQHRERWEISKFGEPGVLPAAEARLASLAHLLQKIGVNPEDCLEAQP
jgi:hypothetical protein